MITADDGKLVIAPHFVESEEELLSDIVFEQRDASLRDSNGNVIMDMPGVEFPVTWSDTAVNVTVDKYFRINKETGERETSLKQVVNRVADTIARYGLEKDYFDKKNAGIFSAQLKYMLYQQMYSFNSPVWFNVGIEPKPRTSACFILDVEDDMGSIMSLARKEAFIFKSGSGSGVNMSKLRGRGESLSAGGYSSGSVSFMKGLDAFAGQIKSGGATRRAAKLVVLDADHPDIEEFIICKSKEEKKALALVGAGYSSRFNDEDGAYQTVAFQNENHSIMVPDKFMSAVEADEEWDLIARLDNSVCKVVKARELFRMMSEAAWECGDPGLQFYDTINRAYTTPSSGNIRGGNPCSEFLDVPNNACNLGSLNLMTFVRSSGGTFYFDMDSYSCAVEIATIAQEILVGLGSYPTKEITLNARSHRQIGIGYSNLGTLLMYAGFPYDSDNGRALAASIASLTTATAYSTSAVMAEALGVFKVYRENDSNILRILDEHHRACRLIRSDSAEVIAIRDRCSDVWEEAIDSIREYGLRNSWVTLMAPTGTISFMMDCQTTGIEPEMALVKVKQLVGGSEIKLVNKTIVKALRNLGYGEESVSKVIRYVEQHDTIEGCTEVRKRDLSVFDCAINSGIGTRFIKPEAHVKMIASIQPHLSAGISKTVNLPAKSTIEDVERIYKMAHKLGVKSITIYRDASKASQPLNVERRKKRMPVKRRLSDDIPSHRHKLKIAGQSGYLHVGFFEDGKVGELFLRMSKAGSTFSGLLDCFSIAVSIALQYGAPLSVLVDKFSHVIFDPSGLTKNSSIPMAKSVVDYVFRYLGDNFLKEDDDEEHEPNNGEPVNIGEMCPRCGAEMMRSGKCYVCSNCGTTTSCG
jgi:ribonucleoside-diphosphate reductase alpha chain